MAQSSNSKENQNALPKSFDVVAPGKTPPPPSGKPIIVSNRPMIKDPMAPNPLKTVSGALQTTTRISAPVVSTLLAPNNGEAVPGSQLPVRLPGRRAMKTIAAPAAPVAADLAAKLEAKAAASQKEAKAPQTPPGQVKPAPAETPKTEGSTPAEPPSQSTENASPDVPLADNAREKAERERLARQAEQEKIVQSKQFYLPIQNLERKRGNSRAVLWLFLVLVVALIWLDLVLDAGVVRVPGIHALTHFFKS